MPFIFHTSKATEGRWKLRLFIIISRLQRIYQLSGKYCWNCGWEMEGKMYQQWCSGICSWVDPGRKNSKISVLLFLGGVTSWQSRKLLLGLCRQDLWNLLGASAPSHHQSHPTPPLCLLFYLVGTIQYQQANASGIRRVANSEASRNCKTHAHSTQDK